MKRLRLILEVQVSSVVDGHKVAKEIREHLREKGCVVVIAGLEIRGELELGKPERVG